MVAHSRLIPPSVSRSSVVRASSSRNVRQDCGSAAPISRSSPTRWLWSRSASSAMAVSGLTGARLSTSRPSGNTVIVIAPPAVARAAASTSLDSDPVMAG